MIQEVAKIRNKLIRKLPLKQDGTFDRPVNKSIRGLPLFDSFVLIVCLC